MKGFALGDAMVRRGWAGTAVAGGVGTKCPPPTGRRGRARHSQPIRHVRNFRACPSGYASMSLRSSADFKLNCCILCPMRTQHLLILNPSHIRNAMCSKSSVQWWWWRALFLVLPRLPPAPRAHAWHPSIPPSFLHFHFKKSHLSQTRNKREGERKVRQKLPECLSLPPRPLFSRGLFLGKKTRKRSISLRGRKDEGGRKTEEGTRRNIKKEWR